MKINTKKLNNKGFTLVELLAVIVILALVMGIAASYIISTMNESRSATLHNTAQNAAATLNSWVANDVLVTGDAKKQLGSTFETAVKDSGTWKCLGSTGVDKINGTKGETPTVDLLNALGLGEPDIVIKSNGTAPVAGNYVDSTTGMPKATCSAIRYNTVVGGYELFLLAGSDGKFYVSGDENYAFSRAGGYGQVIAD